MAKILFVSSEVHPLSKTGGLADVSASLPQALAELGHEVRILTPAYGDTLERLGAVPERSDWRDPVAGTTTRLRETALPDIEVPVWLLDAPGFSDRSGNPYLDAQGRPHPDNAERFDLLARTATAIAGGLGGLGWQPELIHCNDWQTGLVPVRMLQHRIPGATVFTIHNLAYQGLFPASAFGSLDLPQWLWTMDGLEFHGQLSFMKGGVGFADRLTTVSPTYAQEIRTPAHGWGLEGLLNRRAAELTGILNGIDHRFWDPSSDAFLPAHYDVRDLRGKAANKRRLQAELGLSQDPKAPLLGFISRLADQKGVDLLLEAIGDLLEQDLQIAVLGRGEAAYERALQRLASNHPDRIAVRIGFDEGLAHRVEAGADMLLMPSRFEPCGLNQLYSLRYGTVPVVRAVGGLADSVVDATPAHLESGRATGVTFQDATGSALLEAVQRALALYTQPELWRRLQRNGMRQDFTWQRSAARYGEVYEEALAERRRI